MSRLLVAQRALTVPGWAKDALWRRAQAVPSLDLRFAENKSLTDAVTGQSLITFTRASTATYIDSAGTLRTAVTNLQRWSEDFTQGLTPNNATLTANQGIAPNGTLTADQFLETTTNGLHSQEIADHTFTAGVTYTFSCYAKTIGARNFGPGFPTLFGSARFGFFDLTGSGSVVSTNAGVTASIQAVGDGWYRCSITSTCVTGGGARVGVFIASGTSISYAGDITKGLLLWGAQLEQSSTVGEYIPTTSSINSAPRFDHNPTTGESLGLLVEEQRTNLLVGSAAPATQIVTVTAVAHTLHFTGTGTITLTGASTAGPLVGTGTGEANRVSLTFTPTAGSLTLTVSGTVTNAQLEAGAFRTSYILNVSTPLGVTRNADVASITGANFSSWYRQDALTVFSQSVKISSGSSFTFSVNDGTASNRISGNYGLGGNFTAARNTAAAGVLFTPSTTYGPATGVNKMAQASASFDHAITGNAGVVTTATTYAMPVVDRLDIGGQLSSAFFNGTVARLTYWPQRLPNSTLQAITQ